MLFPTGEELAVVINEHLDERNLDFSKQDAELLSQRINDERIALEKAQKLHLKDLANQDNFYVRDNLKYKTIAMTRALKENDLALFEELGEDEINLTQIKSLALDSVSIES